MKNLIKCLSISMAMMMLLLAACATDNSSNSGSDNAKTGVIGKWKHSPLGFIAEFTSNGKMTTDDGVFSGLYYGNDEEGEIVLDNGDRYIYTISNNNNMTWSPKDNPSITEYFTRI
jgi:hypothetical protein